MAASINSSSLKLRKLSKEEEAAQVAQEWLNLNEEQSNKHVESTRCLEHDLDTHVSTQPIPSFALVSCFTMQPQIKFMTIFSLSIIRGIGFLPMKVSNLVDYSMLLSLHDSILLQESEKVVLPSVVEGERSVIV